MRAAALNVEDVDDVWGCPVQGHQHKEPPVGFRQPRIAPLATRFDDGQAGQVGHVGQQVGVRLVAEARLVGAVDGDRVMAHGARRPVPQLRVRIAEVREHFAAVGEERQVQVVAVVVPVSPREVQVCLDLILSLPRSEHGVPEAGKDAAGAPALRPARPARPPPAAPRIVDGGGSAVRIVDGGRGVHGLGQEGELLRQVQAFDVEPVFLAQVAGRVAVAFRLLKQPPDAVRHRVVIGGRLVPHAVVAELRVQQTPEPVVDPVEVLRFADHAADSYYGGREPRRHVEHGPRRRERVVDGCAEEVVLDSLSHVGAQFTREPVQFRALVDQIVGQWELAGHLVGNPPPPLATALGKGRPGLRGVPARPVRPLVYDAVGRVELREAVHDQCGAPCILRLAGDVIGPCERHGLPRKPPLLPIPHGALEEVVVPGFVQVIANRDPLALRVAGDLHPVHRVLVAGVDVTAEPARDLMGRLDGPGELIRLLHAAVAVGAPAEEDARLRGHEFQQFLLAHGHHALDGPFELAGLGLAQIGITIWMLHLPCFSHTTPSRRPGDGGRTSVPELSAGPSWPRDTGHGAPCPYQLPR